jgi:predicted PurR-regulated permease PerM
MNQEAGREHPDDTRDAGYLGGQERPEIPLPPTPIDVRGVSLTVLAVAAGILLMRYMQDVMIPIVLSILLFYAFDPVVDYLEKIRIPRAIGAAVALLLLVAMLAGGAYTLTDDVLRIAADVPTATQKLRAAWRRERSPGTIETLQRAVEEVQKTAKEAVGEQAEPPPGVLKVAVAEPEADGTDYVRWGTAQALEFTSQAIMILFLTFFLLVSDDLFKRKLVEIIGSTFAEKKITVQALNEISEQMERFLLVQVFTSLVVALLTWAALSWLGVNTAAVWGLAAGVLNSVPYFGPMIVTGGLAVVAFVQFGTLSMAAAVGGVALLITSLEGWFLTPALMGRVAQMNTVAIFAGLLFWSWMWGVWGLLLAVPMMMVIKVTCDRLEGFQPVGKLLGE